MEPWKPKYHLILVLPTLSSCGSFLLRMANYNPIYLPCSLRIRARDSCWEGKAALSSHSDSKLHFPLCLSNTCRTIIRSSFHWNHCCLFSFVALGVFKVPSHTRTGNLTTSATSTQFCSAPGEPPNSAVEQVPLGYWVWSGKLLKYSQRQHQNLPYSEWIPCSFCIKL